VHRNWTREELILALHLYCITPFGKIHQRNVAVINLAKILGRTPSAVALKLVNFAALDPELQRRGVVGARHFSKADQSIWNEFFGNWDSLLLELSQTQSETDLAFPESETDLAFPEGIERERLTRVRVHQQFFRTSVLASYEFQCCITGLAVPELLNASHIVPWSHDPTQRTNPSNGLCLNTLHDRAFDRGLLTITPDFQILISPRLHHPKTKTQELLWQYHNTLIRLPEKFLPNTRFLEYHNQNIFQAEA
jgi:putative restriction endonuclease